MCALDFRRVVIINWVVVIKSGNDGASDIEHITIFL